MLSTTDSATVDSDTPVDIAGNKITWDQNPAMIRGVLSMVDKYYKRNGKFRNFLEHGIKVLNNGKTAIPDKESATFLTGKATDAIMRSFEKPCPDTATRIKDYNAAVSKGTPGFTSAFSHDSSIDMTNFVVNRFAVQQEDERLFASLIKIIPDVTKAEELTIACGSSGRKLIEILLATGDSSSAADRALVVGRRDRFLQAPLGWGHNRGTRPQSTSRSSRLAAEAEGWGSYS